MFTFSDFRDHCLCLISRATGIPSEKSILILTDDAREAARKELEARTGETESEGED